MDVVTRAQIDAETILERHWNDLIPVDSVAVATAMGIDSYWMRIGSDCSALTVKRNNERRIIGTNQYESRSRQRFACDYVLRCYQSDFDDWDSPNELYANAFAASLLMPHDVIKDLYRNPRLDITDIAAFFDVTTATVRHQANALDLHVRKSRFDNMWW